MDEVVVGRSLSVEKREWLPNNKRLSLDRPGLHRFDKTLKLMLLKLAVLIVCTNPDDVVDWRVRKCCGECIIAGPASEDVVCVAALSRTGVCGGSLREASMGGEACRVGTGELATALVRFTGMFIACADCLDPRQRFLWA